MCGRFALHHPTDEIHEHYAIQHALFLHTPRYNIAPTQMIAVVSPERKLGPMAWGLIPRWSKDGRPFINARAETITEKPAFRSNLKSRRVLVPCSGFHEWKREGKSKLPVHIRLKTGDLFAMAGVWEPGNPHTVAIITVAANSAIAEVHERMPAILAREEEEAWLDRRNAEPERLLRTRPAEDFELFPISPRVNGVTEDDSGILEPWSGSGAAT